jgi:ribosomal protein S27AE
MSAICPACGQLVATHGGHLARHKGTTMRWSGGRWFRGTCRGSGRRLVEATS